MPLTKLETTAALVVIDLQKGTVGLPTVHPAEEIISRAAQLARAFRSRGLPVVLVHVTAFPAPLIGPNWLLNWSGTPTTTSSPSNDGARSWAQTWTCVRRGVTQVVLAGISTSAGVESTARSAYDLGCNVVLVKDAMTDRDAEVHRLSVEKIFPVWARPTLPPGCCNC
ncbi:MAG TPA: isochorismatase family protein [Candidatus Sulfotelmatobacter sp.]